MTPATPFRVYGDYDDAMRTDAHENAAAEDEAREELDDIRREQIEQERREDAAMVGEW